MNKILQLTLIAIIFILPINYSHATSSMYEASTFSSVVYDDWNNPTTPMPAGWYYYVQAEDSLLFGGYYGASYMKKHFNNEGQLTLCEIFIAHRGTTLAVWDYYNDFLIYLNAMPKYYKNALTFVDYAIDHAKRDCKNVPLTVSQTGHSLGGLLSELVVASGKYLDIKTYVFDSPGAKKIISGMVNDKLLPETALTLPIYYRPHYAFSHPNAINTCNEQWVNLYIFNGLPIPLEDFAKTNIDRIGFYGKIYYFQYYSLNQHKIDGFYHFYHILDKENKANPGSDLFSSWPVGFAAGYKHYLDYKKMFGQYWKNMAYYVWNNNKNVKNIYHNDFYEYEKDFYKRLDNEFARADRDNLMVDRSSYVYPLLKDEALLNNNSNHGNLSNTITNGYAGYTDELENNYNSSDIDRKLYLAVIVNDIVLAKKLITDRHANVNTQHGSKKYSLLQIAIMLGYLDMVELLIDHQANPNILNSDNETAMHTLAHARYGDISAYAKVLIKGKANLNMKNKSGETPEQIIRKKCNECFNKSKKLFLNTNAG